MCCWVTISDLAPVVSETTSDHLTQRRRKTVAQHKNARRQTERKRVRYRSEEHKDEDEREGKRKSEADTKSQDENGLSLSLTVRSMLWQQQLRQRMVVLHVAPSHHRVLLEMSLMFLLLFLLLHLPRWRELQRLRQQRREPIHAQSDCDAK